MSSSMKRMKTESSPTAEMSLESTGTVQLYKLDPGLTRLALSGSFRVYPLSPFIGWSYMKQAFQVDKSKERSHVFSLSKGNPGVGGMSRASIPVIGERPCFQPTEIHVFASDSKNPVEFLRFAFFLKRDEVDPQPEPYQVNAFIKLELVTGSGYKCDIELKTSPVFSSFSNGKTVECAENYQGRERFFHGLVDKGHPQWSRKLSEFLICKGGDGRLPTIQIKGLKATPIIPKEFEVTPQTVLNPTFSLLDKENKRYSCHREILEDQWSFLRNKLEENPTLTEMKIEGGSAATMDAILHHFYYPQKSLPRIKSFGEALELLKVAHQFEIPKLLALAVDTLIEKMDMAESTQLVELYGFIHKFKIQIVYKLWSALVIRMIDRIVEEGNRFYGTGSILCVESFTEDGYFQSGLLQELARDLKQPEDAELAGEDKAKRSRAEQAINYFKDFVFGIMASKLRTNEIQL